MRSNAMICVICNICRNAKNVPGQNAIEIWVNAATIGKVGRLVGRMVWGIKRRDKPSAANKLKLDIPSGYDKMPVIWSSRG